MKNKFFFLSLLAVLASCNHIDVPQPIPGAKADFTYSISDNKIVSFTNTSTSGLSVALWDFGDGQSSVEENARHLYAKDGTYTVTLTCKDKNKFHYTCQKEITIGTPKPQGYSKIYISGFKLYATSGISGSYYYRFECACNNLWGNADPYIKTDYSGVKLNDSNLPYTMSITPVLLGEYPDPMDFYTTLEVRVFFAANIDANGANILDESIPASVIVDGATEHIVSNNANGAKVGILFTYE